MTGTDLEKVQFRNEGEPAEFTDPEKDNSADSPSDKTNKEGDPAAGGDDNSGKNDDKLPFHEHPRWKERENEWESRLTSQQKSHEEDLKKLRDEFFGTRAPAEKRFEENAIPLWFGGSKEQWVAYQKDRDAELQAIEERAETRAFEKVTEKQTAQEKLIQEATDYMRSTVAAIEADKTLNPDGTKIDLNRLLKVVIDENLVDTSGRWNYRAGWKIMKGQLDKDKKSVGDRAKIGAATTSENRSETPPRNFKTSKDFETDRPW